MSFKEGDKVRIRKDSSYYIPNWDSNPINCEGEVFKIKINTDPSCSSSLPIHVKWTNGKTNGYEEEDLEHVIEWSEKLEDTYDSTLRGPSDYRLYKDNIKPKCNCSIKTLMSTGCKCGGV